MEKIENMDTNKFSNNKNMNEEKSPLKELGDAIDNGELNGLTANYRCDKCEREATWEFYVGIPLKNIPCGKNCGGKLTLQSNNER